MSELSLNEGQEFYAGGKRFVIRGGAPVQEEKRGPLGGELVRFDSLKDGDLFFVQFKKANGSGASSLLMESAMVQFWPLEPVEINVPQPPEKRRPTYAQLHQMILDNHGNLAHVAAIEVLD